MKKLTVTIGIPALNEGRNIRRLLVSLLSQKTISYEISKIIVFSDGSTDNTIEETLSLKDKRISVLSISKRKGKANAINKIAKHTTTDILIHLDGDTIIKDSRLIERLIDPIRNQNADLTSARVKEYVTQNKFEEVLKISMRMKKEIFESYKQGNNIYTCHGRARALSKKLYKSITFVPTIVAEDAYVYLYAVSKGYKYSFAPDANIYYRLPGTLVDHQKQSVRFFQSYIQLRQEFGRKFLKKETRIPKRFITPVVMRYLSKYPLTLGMYLVILVLMKVRSVFKDELRATWSVAKSSKGLIGF